MDNKELQEFIAWLPNNIEDFKGKTPEEVANMLNDMSKTEDGMSMIEGMIATFKESVMKYGLGDKILKLVRKLKKDKEPVVDGYETNERSYMQTKYPDGLIWQDIYRKKGFDGHRLINPEIILTRRVISPDKRDTSIYTVIDRDINHLYKSDSSGLSNKLNGEKFNQIFDEAFSKMQIGGKMYSLNATSPISDKSIDYSASTLDIPSELKSQRNHKFNARKK